MTDNEKAVELDQMDRLTVIIYRLGIVLAGIILILMAFPSPDETPGTLLPLLAIACGMIASSAHMYIKFIRWFLLSATWLGLMLYPVANLWWPHPLLYWFIHGLFYVTLCGVAFKEGLCFSIPGLKLTPLLLVVAVFSLLNTQLDPSDTGWLRAAYLPTQMGAGILYTILALAKWRMPLQFDIGDKSVYQI